MKKMRERLVVKKVAHWSVIINAVQILLMLGIAITVMLGDGVVISNYYVRAVLVIAAGVVSWGAFVDIREALMTQKTTVRMDMLEDALEQLEQLNIKLRGWEVTNNLSDGSENGEEEFDSETFAAWVIENLKAGTPIIVDWIDWDGHFQVIIGYDTMGTDSVGDDVLIVADPYDTSDHLQDGYYTLGAERFFYMWHEGFSSDGDDIQVQPYVIARPAAAAE